MAQRAAVGLYFDPNVYASVCFLQYFGISLFGVVSYADFAKYKIAALFSAHDIYTHESRTAAAASVKISLTHRLDMRRRYIASIRNKMPVWCRIHNNVVGKLSSAKRWFVLAWHASNSNSALFGLNSWGLHSLASITAGENVSAQRASAVARWSYGVPRGEYVRAIELQAAHIRAVINSACSRRIEVLLLTTLYRHVMYYYHPTTTTVMARHCVANTNTSCLTLLHSHTWYFTYKSSTWR